MKYALILLKTVGLFGCFSIIYAMESIQQESALFFGVKKINDDLYVGKVTDNFYLAIERIDKNNINMWQEYARRQVLGGQRMNLKYLPNTDGSSHFEEVLNFYKQGKIIPQNEVWVAYASNIPVTKKADLAVSNSSYQNPSIEMFVTVVTSPKALITSHMGISRTWENAYALEAKPFETVKHPDQSIHLHSFAAKVMQIENHKRVYMLTVPAAAMRTILINKMPPNSVFVGDNVYKKNLEAAEKDPNTLLDKRDLEEDGDETSQEREERLKNTVSQMYETYKIKEKVSLLRTNPPRIFKEGEGNNQEIIISKFPGKPRIAFNKSSIDYQWLFTAPFEDKGLHLPYVLIDLDALANATALVKE